MKRPSKQGRAAARRQRGFTLVDLLTASCVMIIGTVGLLMMQMTQVGAGMRARQLSEATSLMQQQLEALQLLPVPAPAVIGPPQSIDARGCPVPATQPPACATPIQGTVYQRSYSVTPTGPASVLVQVQVAWQDPDGQPHSVSVRHGR